MEMKSISIRERNVIVAMPSDTGFLDEMEQSLQIETYIRRNAGRTATDAIEDIKSTKIREGRQRTERCRDLIIEALKKAAIYVNGNRLDIKEKPPEQRINDAFRTLVESIYTKQNYITTPFLSSESLRAILTAKDNQLKLDGVTEVETNHLALTEMLEVIERSHYKNLSTTMRSITDQFGKVPYRWLDMDIAGIILTLFKKQKIRFEMNGENIATSDISILNYITKREYHDRLVVKWRDIVNPTLIANAKTIAKDVFGRGDVPSDEDGLMLRIKDFAAAELTGNNDSIKDLLHEYTNARYPGKAVLESGKKLLEQIDKTKDIRAFYAYLQSEKDALLDYEEDVQDVKKFFKNQRTIFDNALKMLDIYEGNRSYVLDPETIGLVEDIEEITRLQSPYSEIHKLPELITSFRNRFARLLEEECEPIRASINADYEATIADLNRRAFKDTFAGKVKNEFDALLDRLSRANNIYEAIAMLTESDRMKQRHIQSFINEQVRIDAEKETPVGEPSRSYTIKIKTVSVKSLFSGTTQVSNIEEIDHLLNGVRTKLEAQLEDNTTIQII
jgi:hypothetical protein